ncbi:Zinc carboxypeptidase [Cesiribacter andamanensis AMV16]|uniref:Zinc carboxypeptidase n=1 Tax=Cesiribacter andamanensis AMV16 TaxID=1279009 RepID=M7N772_9BACT|nr:Zinc carboxypeptidase [Cesiribacter andamanensis AMV16]
MSLLWLLPLLSLQAQDLQNPDEFLGYPLGSRFTPHYRVVQYFQYIAANSDKAQLQEYGTTYEHRPLLLSFISSPQNLARLEQIRQNNLRRAGLLSGTPDDGANPIAIVWLSYNVHGNESVSTEAAMAVLHELVQPQNDSISEWLDRTLVIMDPAVNPDGRDRYVNWYNSVVGQQLNALPEAREHQEPWPGGRANHYLFDLNRDWAWQTQRESRQRMEVYNQWLPHIHADFHEQGVNEPYYFAPAAEPFHQYITDWQREFQTLIGLNNTRYFDENSWLYFTRERFDLLYPSYGDTYPTFNGAIGMTYEQGGSGRAGLAIVTDEGDTLTLKDRILHHYTASISTIEATATNHQQVVRNFEGFFRKASQTPPGQYRSYVIPARNAGNKRQALLDFLEQHQIQWGEATGQRSLQGWSYTDGRQSSFRTNAGDIVISARQPKAVLVQVLLDPTTQVSDSLTYDITAWSLPYVFGLEAYATSEAVAARTPTARPDYALNLSNDTPYAYVLPWQGLDDARFLAELLQQGIKVRYSMEPFTTNNRQYGRGSLIITRTGNQQLGERFDAAVREAARNWERPLQGVSTGFVAEGKDFGSSTVRYIKPPRVAVLSGEGVSSLAFGEVWHFFDQQLGYPATILGTNYISRVDLAKFDVLVLPSGYYSSLSSGDMLDRIMSWVRGGGRLILMGDAINTFAGKEGIALERKSADSEEGEDKKDENMEDRLRQYQNRERESISDYNAGSIYRVQLDPTHPLAFGYGDTYFTLKTDAEAYQYLKGGWNVGTIRSQNALVSGFVGRQAKERLANTLVFGVEEKGQGQIIYMVDNPLFRAFWHSGKLFFTNAVFMVGQ